MYIKKIDFQIIPHKAQRYETCGDYWIEGDTLHFRVSQMSDWRYHWLVFIHEAIEFVLVSLKGISIDTIDAFDKEFEANRPEGNTDEPGSDPKAPYFNEHLIATNIERLLAFFMDVHWDSYEEEVESL